MKDTILRARLQHLGMHGRRANHITALLRDRIHPVAVVANVKLRDHYAGVNGMAGYEYDELSGLFSKIKKGVKKVGKAVGKGVKTVVKKASGVAAAVAPIVPAAGVIAVTGSLLKAKDKKKKIKKQQKQLSASLAAGGTVAVPTPVTYEAEGLARGIAATGGSVMTTDIMRAMLAEQGIGMNSPQAQQLLSEVAAQGVESTPEGPSALPSWVVPVGAAVAVALLLPSLMGGRRR